MFMVKAGISMLFVKCKTRGEQLGVVVGMVLLIAVCYGVGRFFLGFGGASLETLQQEDISAEMQSDVGHLTVYGYATVALCAVLGLVFSIVAVVNAFRYLTRTGLAPDDGWS
ncbi:MAG: hypothetical protein AB8C13_01845 [Phycisphaerales bacterium]